MSELSDHDRLFATMCETGIHSPIPAVYSVTDVKPESLIALEETICGLCATYYDRDVLAFVRAQALETQRHFPGNTSDAGTDSIESFLTGLNLILGLVPRKENSTDLAMSRTLVAITPTVRAQLLLHSGEEAVIITPDLAPQALLVMHRILGLGIEAGVTAVTYQSAMAMFRAHRDTIVLLAALNRMMTWDRMQPCNLVWRGSSTDYLYYVRIVKALVENQKKRSGPRTLGEILIEHLPNESTVRRLNMLASVARHLNGRIVPLGSRVGKPGLRQLRYALGRWGVENLDDSFLVQLGLRRAAKMRTSIR